MAPFDLQISLHVSTAFISPPPRGRKLKRAIQAYKEALRAGVLRG